MKRIVFLTLLLALALLLTACGAPANDPVGSSASAAGSAPVESAPIPAGEYADGAGDSLTLVLREDGGYRVDFVDMGTEGRRIVKIVDENGAMKIDAVE